MDKIAERLSKWFGSTPFILLHVIWFSAWVILHFTMGLDPEWKLLTLIVSLEAIFLALFVLRAENIQGARMEHYTKQAAKDTKKDLELSDTIINILKKGK